jgi:hypothetical protein
MPLGELLNAQTRWGTVRTRKQCERLGISEQRRVGALTERERAIIAGDLTGTLDATLKRFPGQLAL